MHLALQNAETINRLVEQGELLLKTFHVEHEKDPAGANTELMRGELIGWRSTLHTVYRDYAEDIVTRVLARTHLTVSRQRSSERCRSWLVRPFKTNLSNSMTISERLAIRVEATSVCVKAAKRKFRIVKREDNIPVLGVCEYCNAEFTADPETIGRPRDAHAFVQKQFIAHKCKRRTPANAEYAA